MKIREDEIPLFRVHMAPENELIPALRRILYSGQISEGEPVYEFEARFSEFCGHPNVLSFYSGTAAIHAALLLAGVGRDDEVVTTPMTAEPTNMAVLHAGAKVVWADVDPLSGNVTASSVEAAITKRTKAIIVVHYGGLPAAMTQIQEVARKYGLVVIEDAAHALGARYNGKPIGFGSDYVVYSLQAIKHMTTVDGGMLAIRDSRLLERARKLRWFGIDRKQPRTGVDIEYVGFKYHMNNVNATIGLVQLKHIQPVIQAHVDNGRYFDSVLVGDKKVTICPPLPGVEPSYWFYTLLSDNREALSRHLSRFRIQNSQCHRRNDEHSVFAASRCHLPGLDRYFSRMIHVPCGWWLSEEQRDYIVAVVSDFSQKA